MKLLLIWLFFTGQAYASIKVRAREHIEVHTVDRNEQKAVYRGLSNTINIWYEKPYEYSFGLAFGPLLGSAKALDSEIFGSEFTLYSINFEYKVFPSRLLMNTYTRLGLGYSQFRPENDLGIQEGANFYTGLGYEFAFDSFGLALELAYRHTELSAGISVDSFTPSLGLHFYKMI